MEQQPPSSPQNPWRGSEPDPVEQWFSKMREKIPAQWEPAQWKWPQVFLATFFVLFLTWFLEGFYQVESREQAVVLRWGVFHRLEEPGLHWLPTGIEDVRVLNIKDPLRLVVNQNVLTQDELLLRIEAVLEYTLSDPVSYVLNSDDPEQELSALLQHALTTLGSAQSFSTLLFQPQFISVEMSKRLGPLLQASPLGVRVKQIVVKQAVPPVEVAPIFYQAQKASLDNDKKVRQTRSNAEPLLARARLSAQQIHDQVDNAQARMDQQLKSLVAMVQRLRPAYAQNPRLVEQLLISGFLQQEMALSTSEGAIPALSTPKTSSFTPWTGKPNFSPLDSKKKSRWSDLPPLTEKSLPKEKASDPWDWTETNANESEDQGD